MNTKTFQIGLLSLLASLLAASGQQHMSDAEALYWRAAALMPRAYTPAQLETQRFIDQELLNLPIQVFNLRPDAGEWLLASKPAFDQVDMALAISSPDLNMGTAERPRRDLYPYLERLTRHLMASAKARAYILEPDTAARRYAQALGIALVLSDLPDLDAKVLSANLIQELCQALEGALPTLETPSQIAMLSEAFITRKHPAIQLGNALRKEQVDYTRWLMEQPEQTATKLSMLYGQSETRPALDALDAMPAIRRPAVMREWMKAYWNQMDDLREAVSLPYTQGLSQIKKLDALRAKMEKNPELNPMIPLLTPEIQRLYERIMLTEAQLNAAEFLVTAAAFKHDKGRWPFSSLELSDYSPHKLPSDPYTGMALYYKLKHGAPRIIIRVPKWIASSPNLFYEYNFYERGREDEKRLKEAGKRWAPAVTETPRPTE